MAHKLPDEIIDLILSYAPDFHDNLLACHMEMLTDHRFVYFKKEKVQEIYIWKGEEPNWDNVKRHNELRIWRRATRNRREHYDGPMMFMTLKLRAIEITPERTAAEIGRHWHARDINLYYGWAKITNKYFWHTLCEWNQYNNELSPGYY